MDFLGLASSDTSKKLRCTTRDGTGSLPTGVLLGGLGNQLPEMGGPHAENGKQMRGY